jgi:hypothetical protein
MAGLSISTADCPYFQCWRTYPHFNPYYYEFFVSGDATVMTVDATTPGEHRFELYFVEDATTVSFTAFLPGEIPLPFVAGDVVEAQVSVWYEVDMLYELSGSSAQIQDEEGILISRSSGDFSVDPPPPRCESALVGFGCTIGYPDVTFCHPDHSDDPAAPCVELRQGYSADLVWNGRAYSVYLPQAYVLVPPGWCTEMPPGHMSTTWLRRLDLEVQ